MATPIKMSPQAGADFLANVVRSGNLDAMHTLLYVDGVDPNSITKTGDTMLHLAAEMAQDKALSMLIEAGADIFKPDAEGKSVLRRAIRVGADVAVKKLMAAGADPTAEAAEEQGGAVVFDWQVVSRYNSGNDVASAVLPQVDRFNVNLAARMKNMDELVRFLARLVPADTFDRFGKTALMEASENDFVEGIEKLLQFKADPNLPMKDGRTAMHLAVLANNADAVIALHKGGGKMGVKDQDGITPMQLAEQVGNRRLIDTVRRYLREEEMSFNEVATELTRDVEAPQAAQFRKRAPAP